VEGAYEADRRTKPGLSYDVEIKGIEEPSLIAGLKSMSDTWLLQDDPPMSPYQLKQRAQRDVELFKKFLRSRAYYDASVAVTVDSKDVPARVAFEVKPGDPYLIKNVDFNVQLEGTPIRLPTLPEIGIAPGNRGEARIILDAEKELGQYFKRRGFPFAKVIKREVVVDHASKTATVEFRIDAGAQVSFGPVRIEGLVSVQEDYVRDYIPWTQGDVYSQDLVEELRQALIRTGLFTSAQVTLDSPDEEGRLPLTIKLPERKHHSIGFGVGYNTNQRLGGSASWEDRNLLGRGERLRLLGAASEISLEGRAMFSKPRFLRKDQELRLSARVANDTPDAYDSRNIETSAFVDRDIAPLVVAGVGVALKYSDVEQLGEKNTFSLLSLPLHMERDTSDNVLDPTRGGRLALWGAPYYDFLNEDVRFGKGWAEYRHYLRVLETPVTVLAGRFKIGSIIGIDTDSVPADERFYAGGAGSVRGYAYQSVGPLEGEVPTGGRSLLEVSGEARFKITQKLGLVAFLDGGTAFDSAYPDFGEEDMLWGAGIGLRYFTRVGPLRIDIGFPLDRRDFDNDFEVYLSLGQAF